MCEYLSSPQRNGRNHNHRNSPSKNTQIKVVGDTPI